MYFQWKLNSEYFTLVIASLLYGKNEPTQSSDKFCAFIKPIRNSFWSFTENNSQSAAHRAFKRWLFYGNRIKIPILSIIMNSLKWEFFIHYLALFGRQYTLQTLEYKHREQVPRLHTKNFVLYCTKRWLSQLTQTTDAPKKDPNIHRLVERCN